MFRIVISIAQMRNTSPAFRTALLKSERKRIQGVIAFIAFFTILKIVRIFLFGSAMSRWGILAAALMILLELRFLKAVDEALRTGREIAHSVWYLTTILELLFPAVGVAFWASTRLLPDYRPLATPWVLAFFPLILLSVLRLSPILPMVSGIISATTYLISAYITGWRFVPQPAGFTVTQTAVVYFSLILLITGIIASQIALEVRTHVESALRDAENRHQLQQIEHELQIARSIQQSLLPKFRPQIEGFQVAGWSRTATDTGGDFYDWKQLPDRSWVMVLADVTGHGIGPAILASVCRAYSRANLNVRAGLEIILKNINRSFAEDLTPERFATFVAVLCQEGSDELELLSAGHGPILIYSAKEQSVSTLEAQGLPLGLFPDLWKASPVKLRMDPGDIVILVTDGFFEWENATGEQFGTDRLGGVIRRFANREPEEIIAEIYQSVLRFVDGAPQQDDLTAVLIKRSASGCIENTSDVIVKGSAVATS